MRLALATVLTRPIDETTLVRVVVQLSVGRSALPLACVRGGSGRPTVGTRLSVYHAPVPMSVGLGVHQRVRSLRDRYPTVVVRVVLEGLMGWRVVLGGWPREMMSVRGEERIRLGRSERLEGVVLRLAAVMRMLLMAVLLLRMMSRLMIVVAVRDLGRVMRGGGQRDIVWMLARRVACVRERQVMELVRVLLGERISVVVVGVVDRTSVRMLRMSDERLVSVRERRRGRVRGSCRSGGHLPSLRCALDRVVTGRGTDPVRVPVRASEIVRVRKMGERVHALLAPSFRLDALTLAPLCGCRCRVLLVVGCR